MAKKDKETNANYERLVVAKCCFNKTTRATSIKDIGEMSLADIEYIEKELANCERLIAKCSKNK